MKRVTWKELTCPNCSAMEIFPLESKEYICGCCGYDFSNPIEKKNIEKPIKNPQLVSILPLSIFLTSLMNPIKAITFTTAIVLGSILFFNTDVRNKKLNILKNIFAFALLGGGYIGVIINIAIFTILFDKNHHLSLFFRTDYLGLPFDKNITITVSNIAVLSGISLGIGSALNESDFGKGKTANLFKKIISIFLIIGGIISLVASLTIILLDVTPSKRVVIMIAIIYAIFMSTLLGSAVMNPKKEKILKNLKP